MKTEAVSSMLWRGVWSGGLRPYWCEDLPLLQRHFL